MQVKLEPVPNDKEREFRRKPIAFLGEMEFTSILLALESSQQFKVYYLEGHGEPALDDPDVNGYLKFTSILHENYINLQPLHLLGGQTVPMDRNLLVIAGPRNSLSELELQKIDQYLSQGGRLFVSLNFFQQKPQRPGNNSLPLGCERRCRHGAEPGQPRLRQRRGGVEVQRPSVVNPLTGLAVETVLPRPVGEIESQNPPSDAPKVSESALTGPNSTLANDPTAAPRGYSVMAAVEQKVTAGVVNPRGNTRILALAIHSFLIIN